MDSSRIPSLSALRVRLSGTRAAAKSPEPMAETEEKKRRQNWSDLSAILGVCVALLLTLAIPPVPQYPLFLLLSAVVVAAWYGGLRAGLVATATALIAAYYVIFRVIPDVASLDEAHRHLSMLVFGLVGVGVSWVGETISAKYRLETLVLRAQNALARAEKNERRQRLLAEASTRLSSSMHYEGALSSLAELVTSSLADYCIIHLVEKRHALKALPPAYADPARKEGYAELAGAYEKHPSPRWGYRRVVRTGESELLEIPEAYLSELLPFTNRPQFLRSLKLASTVCVPLEIRGRILGAITLMSAGRRRFGPEDLVFAESVARRASVAVDNARLYREAQETNRLKDEFLAVLSHELRTPLAGILIWTKLLRDGGLDPQALERALGMLDRGAKALEQMIEDLLDVSRVVTGKLGLELAPADLSAIVDSAVEAVRPSAADKSLKVTAVIDRSLGRVTVDAARLQQVMSNLLTNAVKFTPEGGRIHLELDRVGRNARIRVSDTGIGIHPELIPHIFERFRQGDSSSTRQHKGLGLGLAIVRHIVELHHGTVMAESGGESQGATLTVLLPLGAAAYGEPKLARVLDAHPAEAVKSRLDDLSVLVVDDDDDSREAIRVLLEKAGAHAMAVGSVAQALQTLDRATPDVLLSDLGMPDEDGFDLMRKLSERRVIGQAVPPAVAVTAYAAREDREKALRAGFQEFITKPVEPEGLINAVARLAHAADRRPA